MSIQAGDVVQLKSGGGAMTVAKVDESGVHCIWFADSSDDVRTAIIPAAALDALVLDEDDDDEEDEED